MSGRSSCFLQRQKAARRLVKIYCQSDLLSFRHDVCNAGQIAISISSNAECETDIYSPHSLTGSILQIVCDNHAVSTRLDELLSFLDVRTLQAANVCASVITLWNLKHKAKD
jgi:hypothetical protein